MTPVLRHAPLPKGHDLRVFAPIGAFVMPNERTNHMRQPSSLINEAYLRMAQRDGRPTGTYGAVTGAGPSRVLEFGLKLIP